jgi:hypothetical protein
MGCCGKNEKCDRPREEISGLNSFGFLVLNALLDVARTGNISVPTSVPAADELAAIIAKLVKENEYLSGLIGALTDDAKVIVTADNFKISFGPAGEYALTIPLRSDADRQQLIANLTAAIDQLQNTNTDNKQLNLFAPPAN